MATLVGNHQQRFTRRLLNYWVAYDVAGGLVMYSAVVKEEDRLLEMPDAQFWLDAAALGAEEAVRAHLLGYLDATRFGRGTPPATLSRSQLGG